jgi:hypothetical protein
MPIQIWGIFALNLKFLRFEDPFMQLMNEAKPKSFHGGLGTKPNCPLPKISQKFLGVKYLIFDFGVSDFDQICEFVVSRPHRTRD